jgi:putative endopeptidase
MKAALAMIALPFAVQILWGQTAEPAAASTGAANSDTPLYSLPYSPSLDLSSMDRAVDPCTDFYRYSCGSWIKNNPIPPDQARWSVYSKLTLENQRFLWGILQQAAQPSPARSKVETEIGDYFAACMDDGSREKAGASPLRADLAKIAALKSLRDLAVFLGEADLTTVGNELLFGFGSSQDYADSSRVIGFLTAGGLGLPDRDYYVKTDAKSIEIRQRYAEHVQQMLELAGEPAPQAKTDAQTVMEIETALAKASLTRVDQRDPHKLFHPYTLAKLQKLTPAFPWKVYFAATQIAVPPLNITEPDFFVEMQALLTSRSMDDWKTYLRWHMAHLRAPLLSEAFVMANFDFYSKYLRGVQQIQPLWKRCVRRVDQDLGEALGQVFVEKTFGADTKTRAVKMTKEIETAMQSEIEQLPWMGAATKKSALEKLHAVANKIGYPDHWRDYSSIKILRDDYFGNVERATKFENRRQLAKIGKPLDRSEWQMTPPTVNAYYDPQMNDINFPAGVLQPPLYDPKMDDAPNYGNTGATIGHELTHGFDDEGRQFDADGNLRDWWQKKDEEAFNKLADCIVKEYSSFEPLPGVHLNGKLTLGENTADNGGLRLAYMALMDSLAKHTNAKDKQEDGYTPAQRFFLGWGQVWCANERPEVIRLRAQTNPHSPPEFRVNGVLQNMEAFSQAWGCKPDQKMFAAPDKACRVW